MDGSDSVKLTLAGQEYKFRFTMPRLKEINNLTGKGTTQLMLEASQLHYGALELLLWAGLAHPGNPKLRDATVAETAKLFNLKDSRAITSAFLTAFEASFGPAEDGTETENPRKPAAAA